MEANVSCDQTQWLSIVQVKGHLKLNEATDSSYSRYVGYNTSHVPDNNNSLCWVREKKIVTSEIDLQ